MSPQSSEEFALQSLQCAGSTIRVNPNPLYLQVESKGMHTGEPVTLRVFPHTSSSVQIFCADASGSLELLWDTAKVQDNTTFTARNATVLQKGDLELGLTEHFLAAALLFHLDFPQAGWKLEVHGPEIPVLEGSASLWLDWLKHLWLQQEKSSVIQTKNTEMQSSPTKGTQLQTADSKLPESRSQSPWFLIAEPAAEFSLHYELTLPDLAPQSFHWSANEGASAIASARTFISQENLLQAQQAGLLLGVQEGHGLLYNPPEFPRLLSGGSLRWDNEFARHKALDFLGDLALSGLELPKFRFHVKNGGHWLHQMFLRDFLQDNQAEKHSYSFSATEC